MMEPLTGRVVVRVGVWTSDEEVKLLSCGVHAASRRFLAEQRVVHFQCLAVADALRHHEAHLVVLVEELTIDGDMSNLDFHFASRIRAFIHQHASPHARFLHRTLRRSLLGASAINCCYHALISF